MFPVESGVDLLRLAEALAAMEPGTNMDREQSFLSKFAPTLSGVLDEPSIILGEGGTVALWYLPGALARPTQVCPNTAYFRPCSLINSGKYSAGFKSASYTTGQQYNWADLANRTAVF